MNFKKPNIKMSDAHYQDLAESCVKVIDKVGKEKVLEAYKAKPVRAMWEIFHEVNFQKKNDDLHPSFKREPDRRVIAYDKNFDAYAGGVNDSHIQSALKSIFSQIFPDVKMASGGEVSLNAGWTQDLQRAFDVGQETHELWDVELDRSDDSNVKLTGDEGQVDRMRDYLSNSRVLASGGEAENKGIDLFEDYKNIPPKVQKILDKYEDGFTDGDYGILATAKKELEAIGYTFEYYLDGVGYDLRKIDEMGKVEYAEKHHIGLMAKGGAFKVNKKYTHFAVSKATGKIVNGWETISDIESLKYYAKTDLQDMDLKPSDYKILSAPALKQRGIDPFDWASWENLGQTKISNPVSESMEKGGKIGERYKMGEDIVYVGEGFGVKGYEDDIHLYYEEDDSIVKAVSKNALDKFIIEGKLIPISKAGGSMESGGKVNNNFKDKMKKFFNHFASDGALIFGGSYFDSSSSIMGAGGTAGNKLLEFKWGRTNAVSLYVNDTRVTTAGGGGYDKKGTVLGEWMQKEFQDELKKLYAGKKKESDYYGMGKSDAGDKIWLDGASGFNSMENILNAIGYGLDRVASSKNADKYILVENKGKGGYVDTTASADVLLNVIPKLSQELIIDDGGEKVATKEEMKKYVEENKDKMFYVSRTPNRFFVSKRMEKGGTVIKYPSERLEVAEQSEGESQLELSIDNDGDLYRQRVSPIRKNLMTKIAQGKFDINLAPKIYLYLIDEGQKKFMKDVEDYKDYGVPITKAQKENLAKEYVNRFLDEAELGNYVDYLPKKYAMEKGGKAKTEDDYEEYLNDLYSSVFDADSAVDKFIYMTVPSRGDHLSEEEIQGHFYNNTLGTMLKEYDPIAFNVGFGEWE